MSLSNDPFDELRRRNPWKKLRATPPYILDEDRVAIEQFNATRARIETRIQTDVVPEPFIGSPYASVWLLNLNPGFDETDLLHSSAVKEQQLQSAYLNSTGFWYLGEQFSETGGHRWWSRRLREAITEHGENSIRHSLFCVEFFPYHSKTFDKRLFVASQKFTFDLVRRGIELGKSFVFMRSVRAWNDAVSELKGASSIQLKNPRSPYVTRRNLSDPHFRGCPVLC
ncbi:hypothetical protein [Aestuariivirga sp.]|uniref:hypothetical protein n=1 Tax=Aestuariivirga sp. TaxID=2650926 RepID=UPI003592ED16